MQDLSVSGEEIDSEPPPQPLHRDRYSPWSIAIIVIVVVLQIVMQSGFSFSFRHGLAESRSSDPGEISSDEFDGLVTVNDEAKAAYALTQFHLPGLGLSKRNELLENALGTATGLLRRYPDDSAFARRVILIRAELGQNVLAPIPATRRLHGLSSPLDSYALSARGDKSARRSLIQEADVWKAMFNAPIGRGQYAAMRASLDKITTLRWFKLLALHQLYLRTGKTQLAKQEEFRTTQTAAVEMTGFGALDFAYMLLMLVSLVTLIVTVSTGVRSANRYGQTELPPTIVDRFLIPRKPLIENSDRKLRAGVLLDIFAIYMIALQAVSYAIDYAALYFLKPHLGAMSEDTKSAVRITLAFAGYVGGSLVAYVVLAARASRLGASLDKEIGLNARQLGRQIGFGLISWGMALVLMVVVVELASSVFHAAAAPTNPALPLLVTAPSIGLRIMLYVMVAIAAPVFEELFFRGTLLNALLLRFSPAAAVIITGCVFGLVHPVGIVEAFGLATLGAVFAWIAYLRKSLAPSMFAHCLQNSYSYFVLYVTFSTCLPRLQ